MFLEINIEPPTTTTEWFDGKNRNKQEIKMIYIHIKNGTRSRALSRKGNDQATHIYMFKEQIKTCLELEQNSNIDPFSKHLSFYNAFMISKLLFESRKCNKH